MENNTKCPHCQDEEMIEKLGRNQLIGRTYYFCNNCGKTFEVDDNKVVNK